MGFELDLMEYLRSISIKCSPCAQNCIRSCTADERAGPVLKKSFSLVKIGALRRCALEPWEAVVLYFRMRGKRAECNWGKQMMWTERHADSPDCPWDQRMPFLQTHFALGSCHWNFWGTEGSCLHFGGGFDSQRGSQRLKGGLHSAGWIWPTRGELEAVEARAWSYWEPWTAAEERAGGVQEGDLALGYAEIKRKIRPGVCEQTPAIPDHARTEAGDSQPRSISHGMKPGQATALLLFSCDSYSLLSSEKKGSFFPIWTVLILPIELLLVLKILRNKPNYFMLLVSKNLQENKNWMESSEIFFFSFSCVFWEMYDLMSSLSVHLYSYSPQS